MTVILHPAEGMNLTDLVRLIMDISDGPRNAVRVTAGGVLVDDLTALRYLQHTIPATAPAAVTEVTIIEPDPPHPPPPDGTGDPDAPPPEPSVDPQDQDFAPAPPEGPAATAAAGPRRGPTRRRTTTERAPS